LKIKGKKITSCTGNINYVFRPLFFNEAIDLFWKHCSLAKKSTSPSAIGVISEYFFDHFSDRKNKERIYEFLTKLEGLFRLYIDFYPIYSTCNDISQSQLFFYSWVEPLLNPKLLLNLPEQHPLKQVQFVALSKNYQKFKKYDNDVIKFSELIRKEMLELLELAENKSFQLNPSKPPTYYGKMSDQIIRWRSFYTNDQIKNKDKLIKKEKIEKAIALYKSWRLIIEIPRKPQRPIQEFNDKLIKFLSNALKQIPPTEILTASFKDFVISTATIEALNNYHKIGFSSSPNKEEILIKLIFTVPQNKLHSLFKNKPLKTSFTCFWGRLKIMNEYIAHNDPDIWLRHKKEEHPQQGATTEMHLYDNGVFWPWILTEQLKWGLIKPYAPLRTVVLSTKLLIYLHYKSDNQTKDILKKRKSYKSKNFDNRSIKSHCDIALNAFDVPIPDNDEVRSVIFLLDEFFAALSEDSLLVYKTISSLIAMTKAVNICRNNHFKYTLQELEAPIINVFISYLKKQAKTENQFLELNNKVCQQFTLMLKDEFMKVNSEQHLGFDGTNLALLMTAFRYKFTRYTKNSYEIFENIAEQNGFINSNILTKAELDFPQIQGYRWRALREYNLFIKVSVMDEKQRNKLYANPLNRLEEKIKKYLELQNRKNSDDSRNITPIKSAFGSALKKHLLPEVANSYPYNMLKYIEELLEFFGTPIELHPSIEQYLNLDKKIQVEILNQLPKKYD